MSYSIPHYISSTSSDGSFGSVLEGRSWSSVSEYRYGFNTQEQDDEVYGNGNLNTALFWEYDTRLGRRWNIDPKPNYSVSPYSCLLNNPMIYKDIKGDTTLFYNGLDGNLISIIYDKLSNESIILTNPSSYDISYYLYYNQQTPESKVVELVRERAYSLNSNGVSKILIQDLANPANYYDPKNKKYWLKQYINKEIILTIVEIEKIDEELNTLNLQIYLFKREIKENKESIDSDPSDPHAGQDASLVVLNTRINKKIETAKARIADLENTKKDKSTRLEVLTKKTN